MWESLRKAASDPGQIIPLLTLIVTFISTVLWGIYVYLTNETFKQIHRQTELQTDALLVVDVVESEPPSSELWSTYLSIFQPKGGLRTPPNRDRDEDVHLDAITTKALECIAKWKEICTTNRSDIPVKLTPIALLLKNHGRTDIISWKIQLTITIENPPYLRDKGYVETDVTKWELSAGNPIPVGDRLRVDIFKSGPFPKATLEWTITYVDARDKRYKVFGGARKHHFENPLMQQAAIPPAMSALPPDPPAKPL